MPNQINLCLSAIDWPLSKQFHKYDNIDYARKKRPLRGSKSADYLVTQRIGVPPRIRKANRQILEPRVKLRQNGTVF